jgi:hypothetical protein
MRKHSLEYRWPGADKVIEWPHRLPLVAPNWFTASPLSSRYRGKAEVPPLTQSGTVRVHLFFSSNSGF